MTPVVHRAAIKLHALPADNHGVLSLFRHHVVKHRVRRLINQGVGLHEASWDAPDSADSPNGRLVAEEILAWVRDAMAEMRRPYGIDHVAIALACKDPSGRVVCSNSFGVLRPGDFYEPSALDRVRAFLEDVEAVPRTMRAEIVGALLSLGDLAYELHPRQAA